MHVSASLEKKARQFFCIIRIRCSLLFFTKFEYLLAFTVAIVQSNVGRFISAMFITCSVIPGVQVFLRRHWVIFGDSRSEIKGCFLRGRAASGGDRGVMGDVW